MDGDLCGKGSAPNSQGTTPVDVINGKFEVNTISVE